MLRAGRVGRAHGLDGRFPVLEASATFVVGEPLLVGDARTEIVAVKGTDAKPIVRVAAATDRTGAEALGGAELVLPDVAAPPLDDDEYPAEDLEGCVVADGDLRLGVVERLIGYPSCDVLQLDDGRLVPLVRDAVRSIDVEAKRIEVDAEFLGAA